MPQLIHPYWQLCLPPVIKTSSRLPADSKIRKPGNMTAIAATGDEKPASARLPDSHVVALRNTKSSDKNKIMLTTAPENALNTNPNTSNPKVPPPSSLCTAKISRHTPNAPRKAAAGTPIAPPPKANNTITPKAPRPMSRSNSDRPAGSQIKPAMPPPKRTNRLRPKVRYRCAVNGFGERFHPSPTATPMHQSRCRSTNKRRRQ